MTARSPARRLRSAVGVAAVGLVTLGATLARSSASYTAADSTDASFGTASCYHRATVQRGTTTSTADGTTTVTISAVDTTRSFLMFTSRHSSNRPVGSEIGGHLASSTSIEFLRRTSEASPVTMTIDWSVITYACGVNVQRGSVVQTAATLDLTITAVASTAQAFVLWSKTTAPADQTWDDNDPVIGDLTSTTNLQFRADALNTGHTLWWQVVEFTDASMIRVQRGSTSLTGGTLSVDVTVPTAFTASRSFLLVGTRNPNIIDMASAMVRGRLTGTTTVSLDRSGGTYDVTEIGWQVVELFDGTSVLAATTGLAAAGVVNNATLASAVDLARTSAFASTHTGSGQNGGRTTYTADDIPGVSAFTLTLTSATTMDIRRENSAAAANVSWFVVSWGLAA